MISENLDRSVKLLHQARAVTMTEKLKMVGILKKTMPSKRRWIATDEQEEVSVKIPVRLLTINNFIRNL